MVSRLARLILAGGLCLASLSVCAHEAATEEASPAAAKPGSQPERLYVVVAESNLGEKFEVNFLSRSDQDIWAIPCVPDCRPEQVFHIYRRE